MKAEVKRQEKTDRDGLAIVFMILGNMLFVISFLFLNEHLFHPVTSALARGISVTFISYVIARYQGIDLTFPSKYNFKWQNIRNVIIVARGLVYAWVQFYLPLPIVITLNSASPIFSAIFDKILYGMHLNRAQIVWLIVAFLGVIVTANGKYITFLMNGLSSQIGSKFQNYKTNNPIIMLGAAGVFIVTTFAHGLGLVLTKKMKNTNAVQINYFLGVMLLLSSAVMLPAAYSDPGYHRPDVSEFFLAVLISGVPMTISQLLVIEAMLLTKKYGMLIPFQFTSIIVAYGISVIRYDESINVVCLLGAMAIVVGVVFNAKCKDK